MTAQVKSRENEAAAMKHALEPDEAALASVQAELKLLAGAERSNRREAAAMAQIAETDAMVSGRGGGGGEGGEVEKKSKKIT